MKEEIAYCIGCGCCDDYGCDVGCSWLRLNRKKRLGVCSECGNMVSDWDNGKRDFSPDGYGQFAEYAHIVQENVRSTTTIFVRIEE